ncbi:MAG: CHASE domain-containing protein [Prochlorococcaceae cyanobacterium]
MAVLYGLLGGFACWFNVLAQRNPCLGVPFWPSAGLAFALVFRLGTLPLPGILLGSAILHGILLSWQGLPSGSVAAIATVFSIGAGAQAWLGAALVKRALGPEPALHRAGEILSFLLLGGPAACLLRAGLGLIVLQATGSLPPGDLPVIVLANWVGDAMGVIVAGPLTLMLLPGSEPVWAGRRRLVAIPSVAVTLLGIAAFIQFGIQERRAFDLQLDLRARLAVSTLHSAMRWQEEALESLRALWAVQPDVTRRDFQRFTASNLRRMRGLQALSWNPIVSSDQLATFERDQERRKGFRGYRVWERGPGSQRRPVTSRPRHVPVAFIEPLSTNQAALGYDIASSPFRADALTRASERGVAQATAPVQLVQKVGPRMGVLVIAPIQAAAAIGEANGRGHRRLVGFVVGVYQLEDLLRDTFEGSEWRDVSLRLFDASPGSRSAPRETELARFPATTPSVALLIASRHDSVVSRSFQQWGRIWHLEVTPTRAFLPGVPYQITLTRFVLRGLVIVFLLETILLLSSGIDQERRRQLESKLRTSLVTAGVAHEIKQPLTTLLFHAQEIGRALDSPRDGEDLDAARRAASAVMEDARHLSGTVGRIRDILGQMGDEFSPIDLTDAVHGALLLVKADLNRAGTQLSCSGLEQPCRIRGNQEEIQLAVLNLLRNALEASGAKGRVTLSLRATPNAAELEVADSGPGFSNPATNPDQLLMASSKREGLGVGLYLVRRVMERHGGSVSFGRAELGGASVILRFPWSLPSSQRS